MAGAAAQTGVRRSEYLIQAECDWQLTWLTGRIPMLLRLPRTCCVNLGAGAFDPWAVIPFSLSRQHFSPFIT